MRPLRAEEEWARQIIETATGELVAQHDDSSSDSMYDLRISYPGGRVGAVEVTAAADGDSMALWRLMNRGEERWVDAGLVGGWMVTVRPDARAKRLRRELPTLLGRLESEAMTELRPNRRDSSRLGSAAAELGVVHALQSGTAHPGSIYVTVEPDGGFRGVWVDNAHTAVGPWIGDFLRQPAQSDVLAKLTRSGAIERHAFLIVPGFTTAPAEVVHALISDPVPLPDRPPDLPSEVTDVWLVGTWSSPSGLRWSPAVGWQRVSKLVDGQQTI